VNGRTRRATCAGILGLEAVVFLLTTPLLLVQTDVRTGVGVGIGVGLTIACVVVAGLVRRPGGLQLGFVVQAAAIALGVLLPLMVVLGIVFLALYTTAYVVGGRIDREKAEAEAAYAAAQGGTAPSA
jgi:preprotein translocase subunit SecY